MEGNIFRTTAWLAARLDGQNTGIPFADDIGLDPPVDVTSQVQTYTDPDS